MRNLLFTAALAAATLGGHLDAFAQDYDRRQVERQVQRLTTNLTHLSREANAVAQSAQGIGIRDRAIKFRGISAEAASLSAALQRDLGRSLRLRQDRRVMYALLQTHEPAFSHLNNSINKVILGVVNVSRLWSQVQQDKAELYSLLTPTRPGPGRPGPGRPGPGRPGPGRPGPERITGSCTLYVGGNWLRPNSSVNCNVFGRGAVGYEVNVNGRTTWNGLLNGRLSSQSFETDRQRVGGHSVTYEVFVIDQSGRRHLIERM